MKLFLGVAAALAGCVAAAQQPAEVHMLPVPDSPESPSISRALARSILLQRLAPIGQGPSTSDLAEGTDIEQMVAMMNKFGKTPPTLFSDVESTEPRQLVILMEGMSAEQIKSMTKVFKEKPAFTIADPPPTRANDHLIQQDLYAAGATNAQHCSVSDVTNPLDDRCWNGKSAVTKYNVQKNPQSLTELKSKVPQLTNLAHQGEMETIFVFLPATAETGGSKYWSNNFDELRRRQVDQAIPGGQTSAPASSTPENTVFYASRAAIPSCFSSQDSCVSGTGNCSSHGKCQNKYANPDGSEGKEVCYTCHCLSTASESGSIIHWAGPMCTKEDISVPFWLFAGFTIAMVSILYMAVAMLYSVGEEKLPGVIGAGVSKSK